VAARASEAIPSLARSTIETGGQRVVGVQEWAEVRAMREVEGLSIKEIARRTGHARNTIRAALRSPEPQRYGPRPKRVSKVDPFEPAICELLEDEPGQPQTTQGGDRLDAIFRGGPGLGARRRGAIEQPGLSLAAIALDALTRRALAHLGGRGRLAERPTLLDNPPGEPEPLLRCERGRYRAASSGDLLGTGWLRHPQPPRRPG
jgi:hypothetical protein